MSAELLGLKLKSLYATGDGALAFAVTPFRPCKVGTQVGPLEGRELAPGVVAIGAAHGRVDWVPKVIRVDPAADVTTLRGHGLHPFELVDGVHGLRSADLGVIVSCLRGAT